MKKLNNILLLLIALLLLYTCDDILEEDITNDAVKIVTPTEGSIINGNTVQFNWNELDGADDYRIQIIKDNQLYEIDSLITTPAFSYIISPGIYKWRVRAENFAYKTAYTFPTSFSVELSEDLSNQSVALLTPSVDFYTNSTDITFTWTKISHASSYSFDLIKKLNGEQTIDQQTDITTNSLAVDVSKLDEDAEYIWKVKAMNESSETVFSQQTFFLDRATPNQPTLSDPLNEAITTNTVTFNWANGTDSGNVKSEITNTLEIATDLDFNTITHTANTTNNTLQYEFGTTGTYYWRVKAVDKATNTSDYSTVRSVIVE